MSVRFHLYLSGILARSRSCAVMVTASATVAMETKTGVLLIRAILPAQRRDAGHGVAPRSADLKHEPQAEPHRPLAVGDGARDLTEPGAEVGAVRIVEMRRVRNVENIRS